MEVHTMHAMSRRTIRTFAAATLTATCLVVAVMAQPAVAGPRPEPTNTMADHVFPVSVTCIDDLRDLTTQFRAAGFTGQASHIAAALTLGC